MKDNPEQIRKLVIKPSEIEDENYWDLSLNDNLFSCHDCNSNLGYIKINWGVVAEDNWYGVIGDRNNRRYEVREIGLNIYCAECGSFHENYSKWFYPEDKLVMCFKEIEDVEKSEVEHCLLQFNQKGNFKPHYKSFNFDELKEKLIEYEIKHPIKSKKNISKGRRTTSRKIKRSK